MWQKYKLEHSSDILVYVCFEKKLLKHLLHCLKHFYSDDRHRIWMPAVFFWGPNFYKWPIIVKGI
jgi:hypothetical protein